MAKGAAAAVVPAVEGIYSATYSGIPVYEFQFGVDLKEHVMRRRQDNWINATHILKAAGFDKPARTRILEREVQKDTHEKIQGGYGKYQGTWIPLESGEALAHRNHVYERLRPIFEYQPGSATPPPAPRHASKPKAPKAARPAVPKWNGKTANTSRAPSSRAPSFSHSQAEEGLPLHLDDYGDGDIRLREDDTPDNLTVASASYMAEDDRYDMGGAPHSTGHRKRKREELIQDLTEQQHSLYGDALLDYFLLSMNDKPATLPDPPTRFQPDWPIDTDHNTALHWASAMGDVKVIKQLKSHGANLAAQTVRGETPLMRAVNFTNCYDRDTFPHVLKELFATVGDRDSSGATVIHQAVVMKSGRYTSHSCSRYYLDLILNRLQEAHPPGYVQQLIDTQDANGNTAVHLAAMRNCRKSIRALLGRGARTDIPNNEGVHSEVLIAELNASKSKSTTHGGAAGSGALSGAGGGHQRSSSPFGGPNDQQSQHRASGASFIDPAVASASGATSHSKPPASFLSQAATTVQSRVTQLVMEKFQDLARNYEDEVAEKEAAERDARRILLNTQADLANVRSALAEVEAQLESSPQNPSQRSGAAGGGGDTASGTDADVDAEADCFRERALALIVHQNRMAVQEMVEREMATANAEDKASGTGSAGPSASLNGEGGAPKGANSKANGDRPLDVSAMAVDVKLEDVEGEHGEEQYAQLMAELGALVREQRAAEAAYVEASGLLGTGDKIDRYRHLLRSCLGPQDQEMLDANLEDLIRMMEEEADVMGVGGGRGARDDHDGTGGIGIGHDGMAVAVGGEPMDISGL